MGKGETNKEKLKEKKVKGNTKEHSACTKAPLSMELANFKAVVRHIIKNDAKPTHQPYFKQYTGANKWRLKDLWSH